MSASKRRSPKAFNPKEVRFASLGAALLDAVTPSPAVMAFNDRNEGPAWAVVLSFA
jgi:hypothetical protein